MNKNGFSGVKFKTPPSLPVIKKEEVPTLQFPTETRVAGVTLGESICETCNTVYTQGNISVCTSCGGSFIKSLKQVLLRKAYAEYVTIAHLRREPDNKFDKFAVSVYINVGGKLQHIGYIPAKKKDNCNVTAEEISSYLVNKTLWVRCRVIGGPQENDSERSWGLILWISDKAPTQE